MPEAVSSSLSAKRAAAARIGLANRWGNPANRKVVRIDELSTEERGVVLALVNAKKAATAPTVTAREVRRATDAPPPRAA